MKNMIITKIFASFFLGFLVTCATIFVDVEDKCIFGADTCFRSKGFPISFYHGLGFGNFFQGFNIYYFLIDFFLFTSAIILFVFVLYPFIKLIIKGVGK